MMPYFHPAVIDDVEDIRMNDDNGSWQGLLGGLRVPIDPRAIFLGMIVVVLFGAGIYGLNRACDSLYDVSPIQFDSGVEGFLGSLWEAPRYFQAVAFAWFLILWSLLGGAINRIIAVRLAKDDSIGVMEAMGYARQRFLSYFLTPLVLLALIAFLIGCNMLAGLVGTIPYAGAVLYIMLYVLVLISTLFIVILGIGFIFGFPMISSAISTEGCDGIEASISVYNYIFARPWPYILFFGLTYISLLFLYSIGSMFISLTFKTTFLQQPTVQLDYHYKTSESTPDRPALERVEVKRHKTRDLLAAIIAEAGFLGVLVPGRTQRPELETVVYYADSAEYERQVKLWREQDDAYFKGQEAVRKDKSLRDKRESLSFRLNSEKDQAAKDKLNAELSEINKQLTELEGPVKSGPTKRPTHPQQLAAKTWMVWDYIQGTPVTEYKPGKPIARVPFATDHITGFDATMTRILAWVMLAVYWLLWLVVVGYLTTYLMASFTTIYFLMRREVDGTDLEELFESDSESDFNEEASEPAATDASAPAAPAAPAVAAPQPIPAAPQPPAPPIEGESQQPPADGAAGS